MSADPADTRPTPWYRQFWPWLILTILAWGMISSSITLSVALRNPPQMMTGDYQRLGKVLVDTHERADRAEALGLAGRLSIDAAAWTLQLQAADPATLPEVLLLLAQHPTDAGRDRQFLLRRDADGRYTAAAEGVPRRGRIIVSDLEQSWWISSAYELGTVRAEVVLRPERL